MLLKLLYYLDGIKSYLEKYCSIVKGINILDRSFPDMAILKPIFFGPALSGINIMGLFNTKSRNYLTHETLLQAFCALYKELCEIDAISLMETTYVFK